MPPTCWKVFSDFRRTVARSNQLSPRASKYPTTAKTWTFNLRAGAKFHNGREITADDFKYSFERVLNPETRSPKAWMLSIVVGAQEFQDGAAG